MVRRRVYDSERHAHFVTLSCCRRRALLQHDQANASSSVMAEHVEKVSIGRNSSARSYERHKSVGLPIRWPPGME